MGLIKNVLIVVCVGVALLAFRMCQVSSARADGAAGEGGRFVEMPRPSNTPDEKVLLIGPQNCPKEAGRRIDSLERACHAAGIACVRVHQINIQPSSQSEARRVDRVMNGELPVVFVGNFAKNNPTLDEVKAQLLNLRKK